MRNVINLAANYIISVNGTKATRQIRVMFANFVP